MSEYPSTLPQNYNVHYKNAERRFNEKTICLDHAPKGFETDLDQYENFEEFIVTLYIFLCQEGSKVVGKIRDRGFDNSHGHDWTWDGVVVALSLHRAAFFPYAKRIVGSKGRDKLIQCRNRFRIESEHGTDIVVKTHSSSESTPDKSAQNRDEFKAALAYRSIEEQKIILDEL